MYKVRNSFLLHPLACVAAAGFFMVKGEISRTLARIRGEKERKLTKLTITGACHGGYLNKVSQYQAKY